MITRSEERRRPTRVYKHRLPGDEVIICKHPSAEPSGELVLRWLIQICLARRSQAARFSDELLLRANHCGLIKLEHSRGLFKFLISSTEVVPGVLCCTERYARRYLCVTCRWFTPRGVKITTLSLKSAIVAGWSTFAPQSSTQIAIALFFWNKFSPCWLFRLKLLLTSPLFCQIPRKKTQDPAAALCIKNLLPGGDLEQRGRWDAHHCWQFFSSNFTPCVPCKNIVSQTAPIFYRPTNNLVLPPRFIELLTGKLIHSPQCYKTFYLYIFFGGCKNTKTDLLEYELNGIPKCLF